MPQCPASGKISLNDIKTCFGGPSPAPISNYLRGGTYVPNITANNAIPTTDSNIEWSDYYGTISPIYNGTMIAGAASADGGTQYGFNSAVMGSMSPTTISGNAINTISTYIGTLGNKFSVSLGTGTLLQNFFTGVYIYNAAGTSLITSYLSADATFEVGSPIWSWAPPTFTFVNGTHYNIIFY